ncbi:MAG: hypothetical protein KGS44_09920 [Alphaproteobacteria bacterium]|nr:hypothetical protein [Alphaproteobacteria bacterium]
MKTFLVWLPALALYAMFLGWYVNWRGPVTPAEINGLMQRLEASGAGDTGRNDLQTMRAFLEADDGREFFMLNLVRVSPGKVADPVTGVERPAREVLEGYTKVFMPALFARGGHPAIVARKAGGYFDAWGVQADPGWSIIGYMRYRSRRDLALLASDPRFSGAHEFKFAAMPNTFSFPTQPLLMALQGPSVWVGALLALCAALAQIVWLLKVKG